MKKFNFWRFKLSTDDYFFELINIILRFVFFVKKNIGCFHFMEKNINLKNLHKGKRIFIIGNGPSLKKHDIKHLVNEITIFVNRGYKHPDYEYIKPNYHVFVDPKLTTGEWEITMLDEIIIKNPDVVFLLNSKWYNLELFKPYIDNKNFNIYWLNTSLFITPFNNIQVDLTKVTYGAAVLGQAIVSSIYLGANETYLLGVESTGFCNEMLNQDSHFYGVNPENNDKNIYDIYKSLYMNYLYIKSLYYFSLHLQKMKYNVYNCTVGGLLSMFEKRTFEDLFLK